MDISDTQESFCVKRVLVAQWESNISGSPESAKIAIEGMVNQGWSVQVVCGHKGPYIDVYEKLGCIVTVIPHKHWLRKRKWWQILREFPLCYQAFKRFKKLITEFKPDVLYINTIVGVEAALASKVMRVPVVWHLRDIYSDVGGDLHAIPILGRGGVEKIIDSLSDRIIVVSEAVRKSVVPNVPGDKVSVVLNGIPIPRADEVRVASKRGDECRIVIGVPGTLRPMKGHDFLLRALVLLKEKMQNFEVRITGNDSGTYAANLKNMANELGLSSHVKFVGNVEDMQAFLRGCDLAVVPSRCDPLPRTVMESMAAGCALVATRVGGIPEMVDDQVDGLLVEYGNTRELCGQLLLLIGNTVHRSELGNCAQAKAIKCFAVDAYQRNILRALGVRNS